MNAVEFLTGHHRAIESRLERVMSSEGAERERIFRELADQLMAHITLEEQRFYPEVRAKKTEDILMESLEEHLSLKRVLADLLSLPEGDVHVEPKLHVLKEQVEHHHKEEEEHLFPKLPRLLGEQRLQTLGTELSALHDELVSSHPAASALEQTNSAAPL